MRGHITLFQRSSWYQPTDSCSVMIRRSLDEYVVHVFVGLPGPYM
jgi:hypothetical protein